MKADQKSLDYLYQLLSEDDVAMLTTRTAQGYLRSRPMATASINEMGEVFFFTTMDAELAGELTDHDFVSLSYIRSAEKDFVSISGVAQLEKDESRMQAFWQDKFKRWVPQGMDDPNLALLKIAPLAAEHWAMNDGMKGLTQLFSGAESDRQAVHEYLD